MNEFVQECRREWKRLGVAGAVANEMAAELEADLADAAADRIAPEEVLGNGIFDAAAFARSWASERGVVPPPQAPTPAHRGARVAALALGAVAVLSLAMLLVIIFHPTARVVVHRSALSGVGGGHARVSFPSTSQLMVQHTGPGAPLALVTFGLILIAVLAGSALFAWRRA